MSAGQTVAISTLTESTLDALLANKSLLRTTETNYGDLWARLVTHMHEHLDQLITYSRANEIVPPWSR